MKSLPKEIQEELAKIKLSEPNTAYYEHKVKVCQQLYVEEKENISRWDIFNLYRNEPALLKPAIISHIDVDGIVESCYETL